MSRPRRPSWSRSARPTSFLSSHRRSSPLATTNRASCRCRALPHYRPETIRPPPPAPGAPSAGPLSASSGSPPGPPRPSAGARGAGTHPQIGPAGFGSPVSALRRAKDRNRPAPLPPPQALPPVSAALRGHAPVRRTPSSNRALIPYLRRSTVLPAAPSVSALRADGDRPGLRVVRGNPAPIASFHGSSVGALRTTPAHPDDVNNGPPPDALRRGDKVPPRDLAAMHDDVNTIVGYLQQQILPESDERAILAIIRGWANRDDTPGEGSRYLDAFLLQLKMRSYTRRTARSGWIEQHSLVFDDLWSELEDDRLEDFKGLLARANARGRGCGSSQSMVGSPTGFGYQTYAAVQVLDRGKGPQRQRRPVGAYSGPRDAPWRAGGPQVPQRRNPSWHGRLRRKVDGRGRSAALPRLRLGDPISGTRTRRPRVRR